MNEPEQPSVKEFLGNLSPSLIADAVDPVPVAEGCMPVVAGYEVLEVLGRGAFGVVYKAHQTELNRLVAIKMILDADLAGEQQRERFLREASAAAQLKHSGIVQVYSVGTTHLGRPYLVMELVEGGSLASKLRGKPVPPRQIATLVSQLARAVAAAHEAHIVHRDLKPGNVLVTLRWEPKIADFGLARRLDEPGRTGTDNRAGTPAYMAPEQARGDKDIGPAVDIYSLGAILYELLTGRLPFLGATQQQVLQAIMHRDPAQPSRLNPKTPRDLETICLKCLEKEPSSRYASAAEFADDLDRFLRYEPILARPVGPFGRLWKLARRRPLPTGLAAVAILLLCGVVALGGLLSGSRQDQAQQAAANAEERQRQVKERNQKAEALWGGAQALRKAAEVEPPDQARSILVQALADAREARGVLAKGEADEGLRTRVETLVAQLEQRETELEAWRRQQQLDRKMLHRIQEAGLRTTGVVKGDTDWEQMDRDYATIFKEYGISVLELHPDVAAKRIRARAIHAKLAEALDDWARVKAMAGVAKILPRKSTYEIPLGELLSRTAKAIEKIKADLDQAQKGARQLHDLARKVDNDPKRNEVRKALLQKNSGDLKELAVKALKELDKPGQIAALPATTLILLGTSLRHHKALDEAEAVLRKAQWLYPADFLVNVELGACLYARKPADAIRFFTAAVTLRPDSPQARIHLGFALEKMGSRKEAIQHLRKAVDLEPDLTVAHLALGGALVQEGKVEEAILHLRRAIEFRHDFHVMPVSSGVHFEWKGQFKEAIEYLREATKRKPDSAAAHETLAIALEKSSSPNERKEAIHHFKRANELRRGPKPGR